METAKPANAAIVYTEDAFEPGEKPMGRRTAGQGLLRGFVEHSGVDSFCGYGETAADKSGFERAVRRYGGAAPVHWSHRLDTAALKAAGALHLAGPVGAAYAYNRRGVDQRAWSLTGVTHTISTHTVLEAVASTMIAPVQSWDALICTSRAVRSAVETVLEEQTDYLRGRLNAPAPTAQMQLPVIPLGVQCADFAADPAARAALRTRLRIPDDAVVVLYAARLSFHAKAHPYPMYLALQAAAKRTDVKVHLILAGWFSGGIQESVFRRGAAELCPDVVLHVLDGRKPGLWKQVWQAGDIYTLLSDNIQESFGLSPVEAMAAGLPVVGSDWDGLRDTIVHGHTGYLAPTLAPPRGAGNFMSGAYDSGQMDYDQYIGATATAVSVDVAAAADAYSALISDAALRRRMSEAARARALTTYDWRTVIGQYQALWADLAARRKVDVEVAAPGIERASGPARVDPYRTFLAYPTRTLTLRDRVTPGPDLRSAVAALVNRAGIMPVLGVVVDGVDLDVLAEHMAGMAGATAAEIAQVAPSQPLPRVLRTLVWLHKHGLIGITPGAPRQG